ncbi:MAG: hypothetical protein ABI297_00560 [Ginsengibacter sp.]
MKKMIFVCLLAVLTVCTYASPPVPVDNKALLSFQRDFPNREPQSVYNTGESVMVSFKEDELSSCKVFYDLNGVLLNVIKYYGANKLSPFIRSSLDEKFPGKEITGITEFISDEAHFYEINLGNNKLRNNKIWYQIRCDENGLVLSQKRWHKT